MIYPSDGAMLQINASAILANAPHPNAAKLFMEHLLSPEQSEVIVADFYEPLRPEVDPPEGAKSIMEIEILQLTPAETEAGIPEITESWRDVFGS